MSKTAYINIEDKNAQIYIPKHKEPIMDDFYFTDLERLSQFLKEKGIKKVYISQFLPNLVTVKISLPFAANIKNQKLLRGILFNEIKKIYPTLKDFVFIYKAYRDRGALYCRCYILDEENFDAVNSLILQGINVIAFYPVFFPLLEILKSKQEKLEKSQIICMLEKSKRFLFIFKDDELIFQRSFEGSEDEFTQEDVANINMTLSYVLQSFRVKPEKLIFLGVKSPPTEGLAIPYEFLQFENICLYPMPYFLFQVQRKLKGKELLPSEYKNYLVKSSYISYSSLFIFTVAFVFLFLNLLIISDIINDRKNFFSYRNEISMKQRDFFATQEQIAHFEKNLKSLLQLKNKKNLTPDIRAGLYPIAESSKIKQVRVDSIEIENKAPQKIKVSGIILGNTFTEKQSTYMKFKNDVAERGVKILSEKWDMTKGEFTLEGEYDYQRILHKQI